MVTERQFQRLADGAQVDDAPRDAHRQQLREQVLAQFDSSLNLASNKPNKWRRIMTKPITRWSAAAAAVVVGVTVAHWLLLGGGTSLTLAEVQSAVNKMNWVHLTYDNQNGGQFSEMWLCPSKGITLCKRTDGGIVFINNATNIRLWYHKDGDCIEQDTPTIYPDGKVPTYKPQPTWQAVVGSNSKTTPQEQWKSGVVEKQADGREFVRFDSFYKNALGKFWLTRQVWVDSATRLPVSVRERLQLGERKDDAKEEWVTGKYEFSEKGPADIYALGVRANLPIVKTDTKDMPADVKELLAKAAAARNAFPKRYRAIIWTNDREAEIDVIYRNVDKYRGNRYFSLDSEYPKYHLTIPATAEGVLAWSEKQNPMSVAMLADNVHYNRQNTFPEDVKADHSEVTLTMYRVSNAEEYFRISRNPPVDEQWPLFNMGGPLEIVKADPDAPVGCITVRSQAGNSRRDWYLDPTRDYVCVKSVDWRRSDQGLKRARETYLYNLNRLDGKQWYAGRKVLIDYGDETRGTGYYVQSWNIDVQVLKEDQFPAGIFDGDKLKQGAKLRID